MLSPPDSAVPTHGSNSLSHLINTTFSYDGNVLLAAIISLLLVILFVLLLHLYAKWFLAQARQRRRTSMSVTHVLGPSRFHNFHNFTLDTTLCDSPTKGLDSSIISSIPIFVYDKEKFGLECVICLSVFEENEIGRNLPKCGHAFHVECIDMWLNSHSNCPICRAPVVCDKKAGQVAVVNALGDGVVLQEGSGELSEMVAVDVGSVGDAVLEIIIEGPGSENVVMNDSLSASSSSLSSSPVGCSLKRMMSRNRSERKVFPSSNANELDAYA